MGTVSPVSLKGWDKRDGDPITCHQRRKDLAAETHWTDAHRAPTSQALLPVLESSHKWDT